MIDLARRLFKKRFVLRPIVVDIDPSLTIVEFKQAARAERDKRHAAHRERYGNGKVSNE